MKLVEIGLINYLRLFYLNNNINLSEINVCKTFMRNSRRFETKSIQNPYIYP